MNIGLGQGRGSKEVVTFDGGLDAFGVEAHAIDQKGLQRLFLRLLPLEVDGGRVWWVSRFIGVTGC